MQPCNLAIGILFRGEGGGEKLKDLVTLWYGNQDKLQPDESLGSSTEFT